MEQRAADLTSSCRLQTSAEVPRAAQHALGLTGYTRANGVDGEIQKAYFQGPNSTFYWQVCVFIQLVNALLHMSLSRTNNIQVFRSSLLSAEMYAGRVACCPLGESQCVCAARSIKIRKKMGQADGRTPDRYIALTARRGQCNKVSP